MTLSNDKKLQVAFVGGGRDSAVGRAHRSALGLDQNFELVAGCFSRDRTKCLETAAEYGVDASRTYDDLQGLLDEERDKVDAVVILTPQDQHYRHLELCLEAGVPVICEKALTATVREARKVKALLEAENGFLAVISNYTGYPMFRELKARIDKGELGSIQQIQIEMPQEGFLRLTDEGQPMVPQDWRLVDGEIPTISLDLGSHMHMLVAFLTGEKPRSVIGSSDTFGNFKDITDTVSCMVRYSGGLHVNYWYSKTALGCRNGLKIRVFGQNGSAEWFQAEPETLVCSNRHGGRMIYDRASYGVLAANGIEYSRFKVGHPAGFIEALANYYSDVAKCLRARRNNEQPSSPYVFGIDEAMEGLFLLDAAERSAQSERWETVSDVR